MSRSPDVTVIEMPGDDGSSSTSEVVTTAARTGNYKLPTVKTDGALVIQGSDSADQISVERAIGVDETMRNNSPLNARGGIVFMSIICSDGKRRIVHYTGLDALKNMAKFFASSQTPQRDAQKDMYDRAIAAVSRGDFMHLTLVGVYDYYVQAAPKTASSTRLTIDAAGGNDSVSVSNNVPMRTFLSGGSGADTIVSGKRRTNVYGGGGNDLLVSRSTQGGVLDGGKGGDRYVNKASVGEVQVLARSDGDKIITDSRTMRVSSVGVFGTTSVAPDEHYLTDGPSGFIDLLA